MQRQTPAPMPTQFRGLFAMSAVRGDTTIQHATVGKQVKSTVSQRKKKSS
ncbi:MAG: hypothetical protein U1F34_05315 [Gammaproteobacteria bacterium]